MNYVALHTKDMAVFHHVPVSPKDKQTIFLVFFLCWPLHCICFPQISLKLNIPRILKYILNLSKNLDFQDPTRLSVRLEISKYLLTDWILFQISIMIKQEAFLYNFINIFFR